MSALPKFNPDTGDRYELERSGAVVNEAMGEFTPAELDELAQALATGDHANAGFLLAKVRDRYIDWLIDKCDGADFAKQMKWLVSVYTNND